MRPRVTVLTTLLLAGASYLTHTQAQDAEPTTGFETPKAVFEAATKASKKKDFKTFAACLTPGSQGKLAGQLAGLAGLFKGLAALDTKGTMKDKLADLDKIMDKHGLTKEVMAKVKPTKDPKEIDKNNKTIAAIIEDKPAFVGDVMKWLESANPGKGKDGPLVEAELKDLKITGDKATGTSITKTGDMTKEEPIEFAKIGGGWRIVLPEPKPKDKK